MIAKVLKSLKIESLNPMQEAAVEAAGKTSDVILLSPTGTGKTLGFLLPVLLNLDESKTGVQAMIIVPSRELGLQIEQVFRQMSTGFKVNCCYGGHSTRTEKLNLSEAPAVLIGTPGRLAFHIRNKNFDTSTIHYLVLDEFDKSLEFGFREEMSYIIDHLKGLKKRVLTSATQMEEIPSFTGVKDPLVINYLNSAAKKTGGLKLAVIRSEQRDKLEILFALLCEVGDAATLIFCNHRDAVERVSGMLADKGIVHDIFHGKLEQDERVRTLIKFRNGSIRVMVTTDLASRGLDIPEIENVIHYQLPHTEDVYIHRNGRTARMNATGTSWLLLGEGEHIPPFIKDKPVEKKLGTKNQLPSAAEWSTLYIAAGKKEKINKMDIVGMLYQKGKLEKDELGRIEVLDHSSYAAIKSSKIRSVLSLIKDERIKNKKVKMEIAQ
jgi:ATP-independent RNA helicase DbpA